MNTNVIENILKVHEVLNLSSDKAGLSETDYLKAWALEKGINLVDFSSSKCLSSIASGGGNLVSVIFELSLLRNSRKTGGEIEFIIRITNELVRNNLATKLIDALEQCLHSLTVASNISDAFVKMTLKVTDSIFFLFYSTQITEQELQSLVKLVQSLSAAIIEPASPALSPNQFQGNTVATVTGSNTSGLSAFLGQHSRGVDGIGYLAASTVTTWKKIASRILVVLQLTLSSCLNQKVCLLDRNKDSFPSADQPAGNALKDLPLTSESFGSMEWKSKGTRGFVSLVLAAFIRPLADIDQSLVSELFWFLQDGALSRGYSYIRLCVIPVLENCFGETDEDQTTVLFLLDAVKDLLVDLTVVYSGYRELGRYIHCQNLDKVREATAAVDCLDDVMNLMYSFCMVKPSFALYLANEEHVTTPLNPFQYHPFFVLSTEYGWQDGAVMLSAIRLFAGAAVFHEKSVSRAHLSAYMTSGLTVDSGSGVYESSANVRFIIGANSLAVYHYLISTGVPGRDMSILDFYFCICIDFYANELRSPILQLEAPRAEQTVSYEFNPLTMHISTVRTGALSALPAAAASSSEPTRRLSGGASSQPPQLYRTLSDRDCEYLIAIAELIASVGTAPEVSSSLYLEFRAVPRLCSLLACPVALSLKGALLRALASLAHSSVDCAREIWEEIEKQRLVFPVGGAVDATHQTGLRHELEVSESAAGVYPCTEAFLKLLEGLLGHGTPDNLGAGYRVPGIISYLEYVIDDVLRRARLRTYAPKGSSGESQRWRITARAVRVLSLVLQNYPVNRLSVMGFDPRRGYAALPGLSSSSSASFEQDPSSIASASLSTDHSEFYVASKGITDEMRADFVEQKVVYKFVREDSVVVEQRYPRRKTAGFILMAMLLGGVSSGSVIGLEAEYAMAGQGQSVLMTCILCVLSECQLPDISVAQRLMSSKTAEDFIAVISAMQPPEKGPILFGIDEDLSGVNLGSDANLSCDAGYWREKTVTACVGLLYECALRARTFVSLVRSVPHPLTYLRTENGRPATLPIVVNSFAETVSCAAGSAFSQIVQFLQFRSNRVFSLPSVPAMVSYILEQVVSSHTSTALVGALQSNAAERHSLLHTFVSALLGAGEVDIADVFQAPNSLSGDLLPLYTFTASPLLSVETSPTQMAVLESLVQRAAQTSDVLLGDSLDARVRVLRVILTGLNVEKNGDGALGFSYFLLGLKDEIDRAGALRLDMAVLGASLPDPILEAPRHCLEAVLALIAPPQSGAVVVSASSQYHVLFSYPHVAKMCYEIICTLCLSPVTSRLVLAYLRKRSVNFIRSQVTWLLQLLSLRDAELGDIAGSSREASSFSQPLSDPRGPVTSREVSDSVLSELRDALTHCMAWVMKISALDIRALETSAIDTALELSSLVNFFFLGPAAAQGTADSRNREESSSSLSPVCHLLREIFANPPSDEIPRITSLTVRQCLQSAVVSPEAIETLDGLYSGDETESGLTLIDIVSLTRLLEEARVRGKSSTGASPSSEDCAQGLTAAVAMNVYRRSVMARAALAKSWGQLVEVISVGHGCNILLRRNQTPEHGSSSLSISVWGNGTPNASVQAVQAIADMLLIPALNSLTSDSAIALEMIIAEKIAQSILTVTGSLKQAFTDIVYGSTGVGTLLPLRPDQHESILFLVICAVTGVNAQSRDGRKSSVYFRGLLYSMLSQIIVKPSLSTPSRDSEESLRKASSLSPATSASTAAAASDDRDWQLDALQLQYERDCRSRQHCVLEKDIVDLIGQLGYDACTAPLLWRLSSLTALSACLLTLSSDPTLEAKSFSGQLKRSEANAVISRSYSIALQVLGASGHMQHIITDGLSLSTSQLKSQISRGFGEGTDMAAAGSSGKTAELVVSVLAMCIHLARSGEGVDGLLRCGIFDRLCVLPTLSLPLPDERDIDTSNSHAEMYRRSGDPTSPAERASILAQLRLEAELLSAVRLCEAIAATTHVSRTAVEGCVKFLKAHHLVVSHFLRVRSHSLGAFNVARAITSLLAVISEPTHSDNVHREDYQLITLDASLLPSASKKIRTNNRVHALDETLGHQGCSILKDISRLFAAIGINPIPKGVGSQITSSFQRQLHQQDDTWWHKISPRPLTAEEAMATSTCDFPPETRNVDVHLFKSYATASKPAEIWSVFEVRKLFVAVDILKFASVFLRRRTELWRDSEIMGGQNSVDRSLVDFVAVSNVFCVCADLVLRIDKAADAGTRKIEGNDSFSAYSLRWLNGGGGSSLGSVAAASGAVTGSYDADSISGGLVASLRLVVENLICVIHAHTGISDSSGRNFFSTGSISSITHSSSGNSNNYRNGEEHNGHHHLREALDRCVRTAERFPERCFIRETARWIVDNISALENDSAY